MSPVARPVGAVRAVLFLRLRLRVSPIVWRVFAVVVGLDRCGGVLFDRTDVIGIGLDSNRHPQRRR